MLLCRISGRESRSPTGSAPHVYSNAFVYLDNDRFAHDYRFVDSFSDAFANPTDAYLHANGNDDALPYSDSHFYPTGYQHLHLCAVLHANFYSDAYCTSTAVPDPDPNLDANLDALAHAFCHAYSLPDCDEYDHTTQSDTLSDYHDYTITGAFPQPLRQKDTNPLHGVHS